MTQTLISAEGIGKVFSKNSAASKSRIKSIVWSTIIGQTNDLYKDELHQGEFWALKNISFSVARGQSLGIIGRNGAGKTTLLNVLAGYFMPDHGKVDVQGRVVSLINLTDGMQMDLTGRENIYHKGYSNGLSHGQIQSKESQIIDFAELNDFIDTPMRNYSSGMRMRLGFSINIHSEADIFLVDEVLAVGDFEFKNKCHRHINSIKPNVAFVMVSHSRTDILRFCDQAILLENGTVKIIGKPTEVWDQLEFGSQKVKNRSLSISTTIESGQVAPSKVPGGYIKPDAKLGKITSKWLNVKNHSRGKHGNLVALIVNFAPVANEKTFHFGIVFYLGEQVVTAINSSNFARSTVEDCGKRGQIYLTVNIENLNSAQYDVVLALHDNKAYLARVLLEGLKCQSKNRTEHGFVTLNAELQNGLNNG